MKKLLLLASLFLGFGCFSPIYAQQGVVQQSATLTATGSTGFLPTTGVTAVNLKWTGSGTQTTCTVAVDSSADNVTWSAGAVIAGTTCTTTSGSVTVYNVTAANYMRITLTALTGAGNTVVMTLTGYATSAGAAPINGVVIVSGTITPGATSAAIQTAGQTATLTGVISGDSLTLLNGPAPTSLCPLVQTRATAANQITQYFTTLTAAGCTPASGTYTYLIVR